MAELPGIGVFGTGTVIQSLVPILKHRGFKVEAIWGKSKDAAEECGKSMGISFCTNKVDELLLHRDVDLVFIHCPPHLQSPIAVKALGIGKHVVCGLPSGPGQIDALKMVKAAQYYPSLMSLICNGFRFVPGYIKMKQLIEDGYIGEVTVCEARVHCGSFLKNKFDWMCDELMGGGVLNLHGSVIIDLVSFLIGQKAVKVHGLLKTFTKQTDKIKGIRQITSDDFCSFQMEMRDGACASVNINSHLPGDFFQEILVCGTKGHLKVQNLNLFGKQNDSLIEEPFHVDSDHTISDPEHNSLGKNGDGSHPAIPHPHFKGLKKLVECLKEAFVAIEERHGYCRDQLRLGENFDEGQYVQAVVDAVKKSSKIQNWVKVQTLTEEPDPNMYLSDAVKRSTLSVHY